MVCYISYNRNLINEISINHEARTPEGLARNVVLIRELDSNVAKVTWNHMVDPVSAWLRLELGLGCAFSVGR